MHASTQRATIGTWLPWLAVMKTQKQTGCLTLHVDAGSALEQYGALPWRVTREGQFEVLLVTSRRRGRWTVPKGRKVKNRTESQSAETEAFEEAGVIGHVSPESIGSYLYPKLQGDGSTAPCRVAVFELHVQGTLSRWPEMSERERRWMSVAEAASIVGEPELADLLIAIQSRTDDCFA